MIAANPAHLHTASALPRLLRPPNPSAPISTDFRLHGNTCGRNRKLAPRLDSLRPSLPPLQFFAFFCSHFSADSFIFNIFQELFAKTGGVQGYTYSKNAFNRGRAQDHGNLAY
jgi:hypothetical protein